VRYQSTLALILHITALMLAVAPSALAQNEIAYRCDLDICLMDPANPGAVTNLTDNGASSYDEKPIWSPDGTKVAFVSDFTKTGHGEKNVFVMEAAASGDSINLATQISDFKPEAKAIDDLAWSPDGSRIAFTRGNNSGDDKVWVENADGTSVFPLEIGGGGAKRHPTWSPDSTKIAYAVVKNAPEQIFIASALGGFGQPLANGVGHEPNWSPNGAKISFDDYNSGFGYVDLDIVNADGSGTPKIVVPSPYTEWTFSAWSPDSSRIAYRATAASGATVYRVTNADASGDHPLASPGEGDPRYASWSPDGSRIVFQYTPFPNTGASDLYLVNADGSGSAQPLTSDSKSFDPAWRVITAAPPGQPPGPGQTPQAPPPHPGAKKPKVVWITKRIFVGGGPPPYVAKYFCPGPGDCRVTTEGKMKGSKAAGVRFRAAATGALAKPDFSKKKWVLVGKGKTVVPAGKTRKLALPLNKTGLAVLAQLGTATVKVTTKTRIDGQAGIITESHTVHLVLKKKKNPKR
jgi:Tol biopolymer transport system component